MTHDPANTWCAGRARHNDLSSCCPRRTNCAHWRALIDWGIEHQGHKPVPPDVFVGVKLCKTGKYEHHRPREATPEPDTDPQRTALQRIAALDTYADSVEEARALAVAALEATP